MICSLFSVIRYLFFVVGCWLLVIWCLLSGCGYSLLAVCRSVFVFCCLLFDMCGSFVGVGCLLLLVCSQLLVVCCWMLVAGYGLLVVCCWLLVVRC